MKLGKEEIQKIVLGVLIFFGLVYSFFDSLLIPLMKRIEVSNKSLAALGPEIASSNGQIQKTKKMEADFANSILTMRQVETMIPDGSPVAWFPTRMTEFFKKQGIEKSSTRMNGDFSEKELPNFRHIIWAVDLPRVEFSVFGQAMAALENEEPLIEVTAVQIDTSRDDVEAQHVVLTLNNLVKR